MAEDMKSALSMPGEEEAGPDDMRSVEAEEVAELLGLDSEKAMRLLDILKPPMGLAIELGEE